MKQYILKIFYIHLDNFTGKFYYTHTEEILILQKSQKMETQLSL